MKILKDTQYKMVYGGLAGSAGSQLGANVGILGMPLFSFNKQLNFATEWHTDKPQNVPPPQPTYDVDDVYTDMMLASMV